MPTNPQLQLQIDNKRPSLASALTRAVFTAVDTLWSDTVVTWSDANALWGGFDPHQALGPVLAADMKRPTLQDIGYTSAIQTETRVLPAGMPMGLLLALTYPTAGTVTI